MNVMLNTVQCLKHIWYKLSLGVHTNVSKGFYLKTEFIVFNGK